MTKPNDSILVTPGSGATVATHTLDSKELQVVLLAEPSGHIHGTPEAYLYNITAGAVGASKLYADLFNGSGSGKIVRVIDIRVIPKLDVAVTGALAVRIDLYRTSAVGTGGTTAAYKSATIDVAGGNICPLDTNNAALPAQITARTVPTGGATISEWIATRHVAPEESNTSMGYIGPDTNMLPTLYPEQKFTLREGQGILLKQGTVASVGSIGFLVLFTLE
jgi:hypothetical protein